MAHGHENITGMRQHCSKVFGGMCDVASMGSWLILLCFFCSITSSNHVHVSAGGFHNIVLASNGSLFSWGDNHYGELGDGTDSSRSSPVSVNMRGVLNGKNIVQVSAGFYHTIALSSDGSIFSWGYNYYGQLGDGTTTSRLSPVSVNMSGVLNGKNIIQVSTGTYHTIALSSDGSIFAWGFNENGELGDGTNTSRSSPASVKIGGVSSGKKITYVKAGDYYAIALSNDGFLFSWGSNDQGQLGDGSQVSRSTPTITSTFPENNPITPSPQPTQFSQPSPQPCMLCNIEEC